MEAARGLVEGTTLSTAAIAARVGVGQSSVAHWSLRRGWVRPPGSPRPWRAMAPRRAGAGAETRRLAAERRLRDAEAGRPQRARRRPGEPYRADAIDAVWQLYVGTTLSPEAIAKRVRVSAWCVRTWAKRRSWWRPPEARFVRYGLTPAQTGPGERLRTLYGRAKRVAERYVAALAAAPEPDGDALARASALAAEARAGSRPRRRSPPVGHVRPAGRARPAGRERPAGEA